MKKVIPLSVPVSISIEAWLLEGYNQNLSENFFNAMVGFMATFEINEGFSPISLFDCFVEVGLCNSKSDVKRLLPNNCLTVNNIKLSSKAFVLDETNLAHGRFMMLGKGKSERALIVWNGL
jgi:tyrosyl-tRNA synthetase